VLQAFINTINEKQLFGKEHRLLLALSGGVDSVVLAHLLKAAGYNFAMAHCNFQLRGRQSTGDELFCKKLATRLEVKFYAKKIELAQHQVSKKVSVQMAARELRYEWFEALLENQKFDFILTAHHAGDVLETLLMNLVRGTGLRGLRGIPAINGKIVRPLLTFEKEELLAFAKKNGIKYRLDKSNLQDTYERNFIRLHIVPLLKQLNPKLGATIIENVGRFSNEYAILEDYYQLRSKKITYKKNGVFFIDKKELLLEKHLPSLLNYMLRPYGFNSTQLQAIEHSVLQSALTGKKFLTQAYVLVIDRKTLSISNQQKTALNVVLKKWLDFKKLPFLEIEKISNFSRPKANQLLVDSKKMIFPLTIRSTQAGDKFNPFGMKGFKLISDFLKDEKLDSFEKENVKLLVNGNGEVIWVIGYRSDGRYKVQPGDDDLIKLTYIG
jgi:tRNA(Ile)-lysidine synthase